MIELHEVVKTFPGNVRAVDGVSFRVAAGETLALCGTSGCGKTTTLKLINRLIAPTSGRITIAGEDAGSLPAEALRRQIGYVLQDIGLFPHWTVARNVATVPALVGWDEARKSARVAELLELVGLPHAEFGGRFPAELSGGQQQRVGVARALAADPGVILMDEPFGALDPITRETLQQEFIRLKERLRKTIVFVTHDIMEAVLVADRIAIMDAGRVVQDAAPAELIRHPAGDFVRSFLGRHSFLLELMVVHAAGLAKEAPGGTAQQAPQIAGSDTLLDALGLFKAHGCEMLAVTGVDGKPLGVLRREHVLARLQQAAAGQAAA